jgi:hypothetical protein
MLGVSIVPLSTILIFDIGIFPTVWYFCFSFYHRKSLKIPKGGNQKIPKGGNQNSYIEEEQTIQWPKEKVQKVKQGSTKHTHKTKDRVTRTQIKHKISP